MNRITLRILLVLLAAMGLTLMAASCKEETPEPQPTAETTMAAETLPPETAPPTTAPAESKHQEERFLLTFVGDCTFGSTPSNYFADFGFIKTVGEDYRYPFVNVMDYFEGDECTFLNLEGPLTDTGYPMQKKHTFHGPTAYVNILTENSVEMVTLANNHTLDYGQTGYESTLATLETAGIPYVERDASRILTTPNGLTIGVYGAAYYLLDVEDMVAEITNLKEQCDLIIYAPHWGTEGAYKPTTEQTEVGHAAIDAGADIVWGSHPHVLQPIEEYNGGVIYYSLGNFAFGGNIYPQDFDTALLQQEVIRDAQGNITLGALTIVPCNISSLADRNNYQPTLYGAGTEEYDRILSKLNGTWDGPNLKIQ